MGTFVRTLTARVFTVKLADDWPAAIVTVGGTTTVGLLLARDTINPPGPAAPVRLTVPVEFVPPGTVAGLNETDARIDAVIDNVAV